MSAHRESEAQAKGGLAADAGLMTFSTHILSLNAAALLQMGLIPNTEGGALGAEKDLDAARHIIDTLTVLREKTRGNLTGDEQSLLDMVLHELRVRFVAAR